MYVLHCSYCTEVQVYVVHYTYSTDVQGYDVHCTYFINVQDLIDLLTSNNFYRALSKCFILNLPQYE